MPRIDEQRPRRNSLQPVASAVREKGGILGRAVPVAQVKQAPLKVLMYGANRVGKTTIACQFPKPLLLVSFEPVESGGAESVRRVHGVDVLRERTDFIGTAGAVSLARELASLQDDYATVVIDGATSLQDMVLRELMGVDEKPVQMSWGLVAGDQYRQRSEKTREVLWEFLKLPRDIVVLAKEKDHNPPKEERVTASGKVSPDMRAAFLRGVNQGSYVAADLGGATVGWLQDCCDCICRLYVEQEWRETDISIDDTGEKVLEPTGRYIRYLRTGYHPNYAAGVRSCRPESVPDVIPAPTYDKLIKVLRGG